MMQDCRDGATQKSVIGKQDLMKFKFSISFGGIFNNTIVNSVDSIQMVTGYNEYYLGVWRNNSIHEIWAQFCSPLFRCIDIIP